MSADDLTMRFCFGLGGQPCEDYIRGTINQFKISQSNILCYNEIGVHTVPLIDYNGLGIFDGLDGVYLRKDDIR